MDLDIINKVEELKQRSGLKCLTIAVDLDGVLCGGEYWGGEDKSTPSNKMITVVNELARSNFIYIYTARRSTWAKETIDWLQRHGVRYHAVAFDKAPADIYIDDKALNPNKDITIHEHRIREDKDGMQVL